MAVHPARLVVANPLPRGFLPPVRASKAFSYLFPDEDAKLLAAVDVPLEHRVLWTFLAREGMRRGEAQNLTWASVDLVRGAESLDENKTDEPRARALDPGVARALTAWKSRSTSSAPDDRVFPVDMRRLADELRAHLKRAGVDRAALFERSATRQPIRAHDLRASAVP